MFDGGLGVTDYMATLAGSYVTIKSNSGFVWSDLMLEDVPELNPFI